jgi:hypothetical protein
MKKKIIKVDLQPLFDAINIICTEYNEKHKDDPIVEFSGHFKLSEKTTKVYIPKKNKFKKV